tara:strand:+ start:509 stop:1216 length:708 start_codon:yes stop_codon:yes gene_type:complete
MLGKAWNTYRSTFQTNKQDILRAVVGRRTFPSTADSVESPGLISDESNMASHRSRRPTSSDSGYDSTASTPRHDRVKDFSNSETEGRITVKKAKAQNAPLQNASLLSAATRTDLTASIGSELSGVQLSTLDQQQLEDLALLVSERGVVVLRDQDLDSEEQFRISGQFSNHGKHIVQQEPRSVKMKTSIDDFGEVLTPVTGQRNEWVSDRSYETAPPSFSIVKANESGGETAWVRM